MAELLSLGIDIGTHSIKGVLIDSHLNIVSEKEIVYENSLTEYGTKGGINYDPDGKTVTSPVTMWIQRIIHQKLLVLDLQHNNTVPFTGAAHAAWQNFLDWVSNDGSSNILYPGTPLLERLFVIKNSPTWLDVSTSELCRELENTVGGPAVLQEKTGNRAYERFGGKIVDIDLSDASGMNLMDIKTLHWVPDIVNWITNNNDSNSKRLCQLLGNPMSPNTCVGTVHSALSAKLGLNSTCKVYCGVGDNLSSLIGCMLQKDEICLSLGTSDTIFTLCDDLVFSSLEGHYFCSASPSAAYVHLLCFTNGGRPREFVKQAYANNDWESFNNILEQTAPGNDGNLGIYVIIPEITPPLQPGILRYDNQGNLVTEFRKEQEVRACVEWQILSRLLHAEKAGVDLQSKSKIIVTGGGANSQGILQIIANVFNKDVYTQNYSNSAAYGAAIRAMSQVDFKKRDSVAPIVLRSRPDPECHHIYRVLLSRLQEIEKQMST